MQAPEQVLQAPEVSCLHQINYLAPAGAETCTGNGIQPEGGFHRFQLLNFRLPDIQCAQLNLAGGDRHRPYL